MFLSIISYIVRVLLVKKIKGKAASGLRQSEREKLRKLSDLLLRWPTTLAALHNYLEPFQNTVT